jgi:1-acyl-sn-glycerol-3-phosphate acyltransferase
VPATLPVRPSRECLERADRIELPWNAHGIDPFGIDKREVARFFTWLGWMYKKYFRVEVYGADNVPPRGRAMLVGNHSGGVAVDAAMVLCSAFFELEPPRLAQGMAEKFLGSVPVANHVMSRIGQFIGIPEHAHRLLENERLLMVFPEGARGTAKLFPERDSLVRFGTGFMRLALETRSPIVPVGFVGGGEAIPTIANLYKIGKLFGVPYVPVTPWILPLPRPVTFQLLYAKPILFEGTGSEEDEVIQRHVDDVKDRIADLIRQGRELREGRLKREELDLS